MSTIRFSNMCYRITVKVAKEFHHNNYIRRNNFSSFISITNPQAQRFQGTNYFKASRSMIRWENELKLSVRFKNMDSTEKSSPVQTTFSALQSKKRLPRKRIAIKDDEQDPNKSSWSVVAHSTAEEYDLEALLNGLITQGLYQQSAMPEDMNDVLHVSAKYQVGKEPREVYFFREGSVVFWNVPEIEITSVVKFVRRFETNSYDENLVLEENEIMEYHYTDNKTRLVSGTILLNSEGSTDLEKYAFSNGMALSVKLAIWEASLEKFVESIEWITENMKDGKEITMTRDQVFRKTGELFALRHFINLSSDLLDTPDFYWDRQNLETLFQKTCNHLNITKRTKVMNEKLNHCCELIELISNHLNDKHHVRLEWMIIVLIMVEVLFEFIHYGERFLTVSQAH